MAQIDRVEIIPRIVISDSRGFFLKTMTGSERNLGNEFGEVYVTKALKGYSKGGHYHNLSNEWFTLISGEGRLVLQDIETLEIKEIVLTVSNPETIFVPFGVAHVIKSETDEGFMLLAYSDRRYDPEDTIPYIIQ